MLYLIPAWYKQNNWCENEQNWHARRMHTEFDDTVKHIQLFHRSNAYPFRIMLLSFAPNFRHFLHRQSVFHAPYWSCFDAIQQVRRKKISMFSFRNLDWPEGTEFIYTPFVIIAERHGEKYAQIEFGEDGNLIEIDMYKNNMIQRKNIYDDRGFVSSTIIYKDEKPVYQDYLTDKGIWKIRHFFEDGHVEVNSKNLGYLLEYEGHEYEKEFTKLTYRSMEEVICEVLSAYTDMVGEKDIFCVAVHQLHMDMVTKVLRNRKLILSYFGDRYNITTQSEQKNLIELANYVITDSRDNLMKIQNEIGRNIDNITDITPFDSRVDFGISQQLNVQKILVPIDGLEDDRFERLVCELGKYSLLNKKIRIHLFTRVADYDRKRKVLEHTRRSLVASGLDERLATDKEDDVVVENDLDILEEKVSARFFVEQCVSELSVSKCMREQRIIVDMRKNPELYLRITGISVGIPQIIARNTQFVEHGKNGFLLNNMEKLPEAMDYYLKSLTNWNEAMVYSYELGKKYTTRVLIDKWREVIDFVGRDSDITDRN